MKAASSETSADDAAEDEDIDFADFFSVLMYYGHMSKQDILNSSRPFLYEIYKKYGYRACENLGVSPHTDENEHSDKTQLTESDYPIEFKKLSKAEREQSLSEFKNTDDFMALFGQSNNTKTKDDGKNKFINL